MKIWIIVLLVIAAGCADTQGKSGEANNTNNANNSNNTNNQNNSNSTNLREPQKHRAVAEACPMDRPVVNVQDDMGEGSCSANEDCDEGDNGRCVNSRGGNMCSYDLCFEDSDCESMGAGVCDCRADNAFEANVCRRGDCRVDSDCGDGGYCSPSFGSCGYYSGVVAYYCHTPQDECVDDADCDENTGAYCAFDTQRGLWACSTLGCDG